MNTVTLTAQFNPVNVGSPNQISLQLSQPASAISFTLIYDPSLFEYQKGSVVTTLSGRTVEDSTPGTITFNGSSQGQGATSSKVGFTFKALKPSTTGTFRATAILIDAESYTDVPLTLEVLPLQIHHATAFPSVDDGQESLS